jgi:hypothetical protein
VKADGCRWDKSQDETGMNLKSDDRDYGRCRRTGSPGTLAAPTCSQTRYLVLSSYTGNNELRVIHSAIEEKYGVISFVVKIAAFRWGVERCLVIHVIHISDLDGQCYETSKGDNKDHSNPTISTPNIKELT